MYGGHIVNDFDRLLCNTYLDFYMKDELLDETEMYPYAEDEKGVSFMCPAPTSYEKYLEHIDTTLTSDTPVAFGLHPNAEIDFRTTQSEVMFRTLVELQPKTGGGAEEGAMSPTEIASAKLDDIVDRFGEKKFDVDDLSASLDEKGPYQNVFLQEMEVMNTLLTEMIRSLKELSLGFKGELTMSDAMETLMTSLFMDEVPATWAKRAWPSRKTLNGWLGNFTNRLTQLEDWSNNPIEIPKVTVLSYLINPQSVSGVHSNRTVFVFCPAPWPTAAILTCSESSFLRLCSAFDFAPQVLFDCSQSSRCAEKSVGAGQARDLLGSDAICHDRQGRESQHRRRVHIRSQHARREMGRECGQHREEQAQGDVLRPSCYVGSRRRVGQGRL